ncbi:Putative SOS response-associated peptidase YedK [Polystyrenella longa]|uniref:Abasic site processing protein n=1 Tax=Polystyrenella longa TaxID=2528007 RepID=A0A518CPQ5_9PLAN|nr:SOS response-associated peptidase [Polystyrenella longa]QDU81202.1 Putative SOS response-associated peptidase YedK [Polystyrenella longa]
MCGRFTLRIPPHELWKALQAEYDWQPRFNIAPSQLAPVVRIRDGQPVLDRLRWGFIPSWAKDEKIGYKMINARSEEIAKSYRGALKSRRCLIVADGWYEWKNKQPYHFHQPDNIPFAFAGLWEKWKETESFTIFTTAAVGVAADYHDRMPVIIHPAAYDPWLDPDINGNDLVEPLLQSWEGELKVEEANKCVGNPRNEGPQCLNERGSGKLF